MVDDITSLTLEEEKRKQMDEKLTKQQKKQHRNNGWVDFANVIEDQDYNIVFNPPGNGSCQFAALARQLSGLGIFRSPETTREELIGYMQENYLDNDDFPLLQFIPEFDS